jgi:UDP-2-acetamido-3-amino-2,3-dideoxy-glucuronate N-acetyltransferase
MIKNYFVHDSSYVDEGATIGKGTKIWHFSHVSKGAVIGEKCQLGQNVFVGGDVSIGNGVKVQNNVSIYDKVILEDYVFCGPSCTFTNVFNPRSEYPRDREKGFRKTVVGRGASLGANSTIVCGNNIGKYAFIGAGAVVTKDVPAYALFYGNPGRVRGWMCECGEKLEFGERSQASCKCGKEYRRSGDKVELIKE